MRLWLIRHGETMSNASGVFQGHLDIELNERGVSQARAVSAYLAPIAFAAVFSSDLQRAARTAELLAGDRAVAFDPDLREMNYGVLQGVAYRDAAETLRPHRLEEAWLRGEIHRGRQSLPAGESLAQFRRRTSRFVDKLDDRFLDDESANVLVVGHGGQLAVLLTVLLGMPARARYSFRFANCGISVLTRTPGNTTLDLHNLVVWDEGRVFSDRGLSGQLPQRAE